MSRLKKVMSKILVVDDEEPIRKLIKSLINAIEHEVIEAVNGTDAYKIYKERDLDLIITDVVMPENNGIDLIMKIKKDNPDFSIIAVSGGGGISGRYDYLEIAKLVGAKNVFKKPFDLHELESSILDVINL